MTLKPLALAAALLALAASSAVAQNTPPLPPADTVARAALTLSPGDMVQVVIYREPELNGEFLVDQDGVVVLPLIGEQTVTGIPMRELRQQLVDRYRVHLRNPSINVIPLRRLSVLGEVQRPGMYNVDPTVSLAGAIALAGGATGAGSLQRIRIIRNGAVIHDRIGAGETLSGAGVRSNDEVYVDRRSWFERNSTFVVSTLISVTSIVTSIILSSRR
jgi:polysaccharide export outer membrane protein